ncbi:MAG: methylmalonyl Co-A mutase-associated GTPase MeaB [bacterium]|nr:methylmalonyl Co-A mutase-associated GTPase MeaB [bacterium]
MSFTSNVPFDVLQFAKTLTKLEYGDPTVLDMINQNYQNLGRAYRIGVTGPPGAGKSSLVTMMAKHYREEGVRVGIIAVDPSSPFSGGALLGDRIRMQQLGADENIFIRSMASRGAMGGLAEYADAAADLFDLYGFDVILLETVGVGQSELEIAQCADTTVVVIVPQSGDVIQGMKAGLMEIGDLFVMNKSDDPFSEKATQQLKSAIHLKEWGEWTPPIINTVATENRGIDRLIHQLNAHHSFLIQTGALEQRRQQRLVRRIKQMVTEKVERELWNKTREIKLLQAIQERRQPQHILEEIYQDFRGSFYVGNESESN